VLRILIMENVLKPLIERMRVQQLIRNSGDEIRHTLSVDLRVKIGEPSFGGR
jgi:hypothetical protein